MAENIVINDGPRFDVVQRHGGIIPQWIVAEVVERKICASVALGHQDGARICPVRVGPISVIGECRRPHGDGAGGARAHGDGEPIEIRIIQQTAVDGPRSAGGVDGIAHVARKTEDLAGVRGLQIECGTDWVGTEVDQNLDAFANDQLHARPGDGGVEQAAVVGDDVKGPVVAEPKSVAARHLGVEHPQAHPLLRQTHLWAERAVREYVVAVVVDDVVAGERVVREEPPAGNSQRNIIHAIGARQVERGLLRGNWICGGMGMLGFG